MNKIYIVIFVAILGGSITSARAENASNSYALTATAGGYGSSPDLGLKLGYDVTGRGMTDSFGVEGVYMTKWIDRGSANLFRIDVIVPVTPRKRLVPFLAVGTGWISGGGESSFALTLAFGGGARYFVSDDLALRGDLREMLVSGQKLSADNFEYTVGLSWIFGKKEWPMEELESKNAAVSEGALPSGSTLDGRGRNAAESAAQKPVVAEAVKAGGNQAAPPPDVPEKGEKAAPATAGKESGVATNVSPGAILQEAKHPERDSNIASMPQPSPQEPLPAACKKLTIDLRQSRSLQEMTIGFALNKAEISKVYLLRLGELAKFMKLNRGTVAMISGHSDSTGPLSYNLGLSRRRSESVKRHLVKQGIAPSRLITRGYGPCAPVASNLTPAARENNRRATAVVTLVNQN